MGGKILGSWSGMRKYLEQEMLAESMKGRIRYRCTTFPDMDGCGLFEVFLDGKTYKQFSLETVQSYFIKNGIVEQKPHPLSIPEYWEDFLETLEKAPMNERTEYTDDEFSEALQAYRNSDIAESLAADNPIQNMFAVLDRRVGKRTLIKIKDEMSKTPEWLDRLYGERCKAEGVKE